MKHHKITVEIRYLNPYLPPRCRKYRYEEKKEEIKLPIRMIASDEAPIAFKLSDYSHIQDHKTEIRCHKGKLYMQMRHFDIICCQGDERYRDVYPEELCFAPYLREQDTREECIAKCKEQAMRYIIIDGVCWRVCGEPRYVVNTFGLGHNHGGTGLFVHDFYNDNIASNNYFSALDGKKAVEHANNVAARRGDTEDVGCFKEMIEVLMPECVKIKPQKEHGSGCEVINALNSIAENSSSALEAGLLTILYCKP